MGAIGKLISASSAFSQDFLDLYNSVQLLKIYKNVYEWIKNESISDQTLIQAKLNLFGWSDYVCDKT